MIRTVSMRARIIGKNGCFKMSIDRKFAWAGSQFSSLGPKVGTERSSTGF